MAHNNQFGLSRHIPNETKREIRERCGYGCVICGSIPIEYAHLNPSFSMAKEHDPDCIVLLCKPHHTMLDNKVIDFQDVKKALKTKQGIDSETRFKLPSTKEEFQVNWSGSIMTAKHQSIVIDGEPILSFETTNNPLEPILISGVFRGPGGNVICRVERNEFISRVAEVGDIELISNRFSYRLPNGDMGLNFRLDSGLISINYIYHAKQDGIVYGKDDRLLVGNLGGRIEFQDCKIVADETAIEIGTCTSSFSYDGVDIDKLPRNSMTKWASIGKNGVLLQGIPHVRFTSSYDNERQGEFCAW